MRITLNDQSKEIVTPCSIQLLLNEILGEKQKGIAVAVNNAVIPKASWEGFSLNAKDEVLIIKATQGG
jgi:sulfur carrier protein